MADTKTLKKEKIYFTYMKSPIGKLLIAGSRQGICKIAFPKGKKYITEKSWEEKNDEFDEVILQLNEYLDGKRKEFTIKLDLKGTKFQKKVLTELQKVPYGKTISYGELAQKAGSPKAARAVGAVNARNPIPIIIPCHRVIGKNGKLVGFGGGLDLKEILLELEQENI